MKEEPYKQVIQRLGASFSTRFHLKKFFFFYLFARICFKRPSKNSENDVSCKQTENILLNNSQNLTEIFQFKNIYILV